MKVQVIATVFAALAGSSVGATTKKSDTLLAFQDFYHQCVQELPPSICDGVNRYANAYIDADSIAGPETCPNKNFLADRKTLANYALGFASDKLTSMLNVFQKSIKNKQVSMHDSQAFSGLISAAFDVKVDSAAAPTEQILQLVESTGADVNFDGQKISMALPDDTEAAPEVDEFSRDNVKAELTEETLALAQQQKMEAIRARNSKLIAAAKSLLPGKQTGHLVKRGLGRALGVLCGFLAVIIGLGGTAGLIWTAVHYGVLWHSLEAAGAFVPSSVQAATIISSICVEVPLVVACAGLNGCCVACFAH